MVFIRSGMLLSKLHSRLVQQSTPLGLVRWLQLQSAYNIGLRSQLKDLTPKQQERLKKLKAIDGKVQLGRISADVGNRFTGISIPECQKLLPAANPGGQPLPEGLQWLLTEKVPSKEQVDALSKELQNSAIPDHVFEAINALPVTTDAVIQLTTRDMTLQVQSEFQKDYDKGILNVKFCGPTSEESLNLISQVPVVAPSTYRVDPVGGNVSTHTAQNRLGLAGACSFKSMNFVRSILEEDEQHSWKKLEKTMAKTDREGLAGGGGFGSMNFVQSFLDEDEKLAQRKKSDFVHILLKKKKTFVTVTDSKGNRKTGASAGSLEERKGRSRLSKYAAEATAEHVGRSARKLGLKSVVMKVKGSAFFRKKRKVIVSWREGFRGEGVGIRSPITYVVDVTQLPHNGCRLPKKRRV